MREYPFEVFVWDRPDRDSVYDAATLADARHFARREGRRRARGLRGVLEYQVTVAVRATASGRWRYQRTWR